MALLTWRILILLRVWWRKYTKRQKFTQEWFKTFALHTTLYVFMWVVPVSGFFFQLFQKTTHASGLLYQTCFRKFNNG